MIQVADAMTSMAEAVHDFSKVEMHTNSDFPITPLLSPQSKRRTDAMALLQELDGNINIDDMVTAVNIFQEDTKASDAYLALSKDGMNPAIRQAWLRSTIAKAHPRGFGDPTMPLHANNIAGGSHNIESNHTVASVPLPPL
jgi:hypothetical protein